MSNFAFLAVEFPSVHESAQAAERHAVSDPRAALFYAGRAVEIAVKWAFQNDPGLRLPYQDNIAALLHEPSFKAAAGTAVFEKAKYLNRLRNRIEARHAQASARRGARRFALATLAIAVVAAAGFGEYARSLPQRRFERALRAAIAQLPAREPEKGIARELPSSRADVRILVLAQAAPDAPR